MAFFRCTGGGGTPISPTTTLMSRGQVSNTTNYMTATLDSSVNLADYDYLFIKLTRNDTTYEENMAVIFPTGLPKTFKLYADRTYTFNLTATSISLTDYSGAYVNIYVDIIGYKGGI